MPDVLKRAVDDLGHGTADSPRLVVDVWLAVPGGEGWRCLMLRRSAGRGRFWQGVSGRVEATDESLEAAARREIAEEIGVTEGIRILDLGRWFVFTGPMSGRCFRKRSLGAVLPSGTSPATIRLSHEHDAARLVAFDEAREMVHFPVNTEELEALEAALARRIRESA